MAALSAWSTGVIFEFIQHYKTEQILWDPRHPLHKNRSEINDAWNRIQSSLSVNYSVVELKKKKESLMTSFRMHWNRKRRNPDYKTSWFAYTAMESFLSDKYDGDSSTNDLEQEFFNTTSYNETAVSDHQYSGRNCSERSHSTRKASRQSLPQPIEIKVSNCKTVPDVYKKQNETLKSEDKDEEDEYDLYGQLLAKKLRKLDEHQRDMAMHEIDNVMFRVKMEGNSQMQQPSRSYSSSPGARKVKSPLFIVTQQTHSQFEDDSMVYEQDPMQEQPS